jgi:two-component system nitrogen regulation response regulator GlnG
VEFGEGLLGKTPVMQEVFKQIALAAAADASVLLEGERGVGKAAAARVIHQHSARAHKPFITANLSAHDAPQAELELFGHTCGDRTDAAPARQGLLWQAQGGTLFLEDVSELPLVVQIKLMHALEAGECAAADEEHRQQLDLRVISATTDRLVERVQKGEFRQDLFHKLAEFEIVVPPLRNRQADIPLLARHFAAQRRGTRVNFAEETLAELMNRRWEGNVRELQSAIEHALVVARAGLVLTEHLPPPLLEIAAELEVGEMASTLADLAKRRAADLLDDPAAEGFVYEKFLEEIEPALLESAMTRYAQECAPAARALGLHRTTLKRKLDQYKLPK